MHATVSLLADWLFDYAGVYAPASLPLAEAWARYEVHLASERKSIVSRFACGPSDLSALAELASGGEGREITVVAPSGSDWGSTLESAAKEMTAFVDLVDPEVAAITAFEVALPDGQDLAGRLNDLRSFQEVDVFVEIPWGPDQLDILAAVAEREGLLAKARTGGAYVPETAQLAAWLEACVQEEQPFKLTAGLHHAWRHAEGHGFLNIVCGLGLSVENDLAQGELAAILDVRESTEFTLEGDGIRWRHLMAGRDALEDARGILSSIGSCEIEDAWKELTAWGR